MSNTQHLGRNEHRGIWLLAHGLRSHRCGRRTWGRKFKFWNNEALNTGYHIYGKTMFDVPRHQAWEVVFVGPFVVRASAVNIYSIIFLLGHYIANRLTSTTICLSYHSNDVYRSRAYSSVSAPPSPTPTVTTWRSVYPRDCPPSYYLLRWLCISLNNSFAALHHGQENHFFVVLSLWCLAPRSSNSEAFNSVHQYYYYNNYYSFPSQYHLQTSEICCDATFSYK